MSVALLARKSETAPAPQAKARSNGSSSGLRIGEPNDAFEREADRVAEEVMAGGIVRRDWSLSRVSVRTPLQRKCACGGSDSSDSESEDGKKSGMTLQRLAASDSLPSAVPPIVYAVLSSAGQPLGEEFRAYFEPRFGHDFSKVRVHADSEAAAANESLNSLAYTVGDDVVFGGGLYNPRSRPGRQLLAHELAHVVQQGRGGPVPPLDSSAPHEAAARHAAHAIASGARSVGVAGATGIGLAREEDDNAHAARTSRRRIAKAVNELEHLEAKRQESGANIQSEESVRAYDAINSALRYARASDDKGLMAEAEKLKGRFDAATRGTPAALPESPFEAHAAASTEPMTAEESHRVVLGQRGFSAGLPAGEIEEARVEIERLEGELKTADSKGKADEIQKKIDSMSRRIAVSTPVLKDPDALVEQKAELEKQLKTATKPATEAGLRRRIGALDEQLKAVGVATGPGEEVPLLAMEGGRLGHSGATHVTIQIVDSKGKLITTVQAPNEGDSGLHAEEVLLNQLSSFPDKKRFKDARMVISGDQEVCGKCIPKVTKFAEEHDFEEVVGYTARAPKLTSTGKGTTLLATAKTTVGKVADPAEVEKLERAQRATGKIGQDEPLKMEYVPQTVFKRAATQPPSGSPSGPPAGAMAKTPTLLAPSTPPPTPNGVSTATLPSAQLVAKASPTVATVAAPVAKVSPKAQAQKAVTVGLVAPDPGTGVAKPESPASPAPASAPLEKGGIPSVQPKKGSTTALQHGASITAKPGDLEAAGSVGAQATQAHGHGLQTSQSVEFGGKVVTKIEEIPDTSPVRYRVTLTVDLSAGAGVGASRDDGGKFGGSLSGSASGSLSMSVTHEMSGGDKDKYLNAVKGGEGGASEELRVAQMVAKGSIEEAKAYIAQRKSIQGSAEAAKHMSEGDVVTLSAGGTVEGKAGVSGANAGAEFGISRSGELTRTQALKNGKVVVTVAVASAKGTAIGGSFSEGVAGMGLSKQGTLNKGTSVTFVLDPGDPKFDSNYNEVMGARSIDDLSQLAARRPELTGSKTTSHGTSSMRTTSASVAGVGLSIKEGRSYSEEETKDLKGVSHRYEGSGTLGGSLSVAGRDVASSTTTDQFAGIVGPDNTASGETSSTTTETDYLGSLNKLVSSADKRPIETSAGIVTGGTKLLQNRSEIQGKKLTDDSYTRLAELAKDPSAWQRSWSGRVSTFVDWEATRKKVLAADGDRNLIAKALAEFESQGSGRSRTVENAVSETGIAFDFPEELQDQKPVYDELVAGDVLAHPRGLASAGKPEDAIAELNVDNAKLGKLIGNLQMHQQDVQNAAALAEMMRRISERRTAIRAEIRSLSPQKMAPGGEHKGRSPQEEASTVDAQKEAEEREAAQRREERNAKVNDLIPALLTNRGKERANFAAVYEELKKADSWFSKPDVIVIANRLNELKPLYNQWDKSLAELKEVFKERGENPDRADQFSPNRTEWNNLHDKVFKW